LNKRFLLSTVFCVLAGFSIPLCAEAQEKKEEVRFEFRLVNQENIEQEQEKIARMFKAHWGLRIAKYVGVAGACSYALYRLFSSPDVSDIIKEKDKGPTIGQKQYKHLVQLLVSPSLWKEPRKWFKVVGFKLVDWIAVTAVMGLGQRIWKKTSHNDDIVWYSKEKTRTYQLMSQLRYYGLKIRKAKDLTQENLEYHRVTLASICKKFVLQVEKLCGFMQYSLKQFEKRGALFETDDLLQIPHLTAITNDFVTMLQKRLPVSSQEPLAHLRKSYEDAQQFANDLERQIGRFAEIEFDIEQRLGGV